MKRIVTILLAAALLFSAFSVLTAARDLKGDLNGDSKVTSDDAIYLLYHVFFADDYPVSQDCDFNRDKKVTSEDAIYLLYYVFFPEAYSLGSTTALEKKYYSPVYANAKTEYKSMLSTLRSWFMDKLESNALFSVKLGGKAALASMTRTVKTEKTGENETVTATYTSDSGFVITLTATLYGDNPSVDYVVTAENAGTSSTAATAKISDFYAIDSEIPLAKDGSYTLHTTKGSLANADDFEEVTKTLSSAAESFAPQGGRSSDGAWPFFDVIGKNCGIVMAVGWTGQWKATFADAGGAVSVKAYQSDLSGVLLPGEKIRTPRIVMTYFTGDAEYGHNVWRKLLIANYLPSNRDDGYYVTPMCLNFWGGHTSNYIKTTVETMKANGAVFDAVWLDAAWYGDYENFGDGVATGNGTTKINGKEVYTGAWHTELGWWTINPKLFPNGSFSEILSAMRPIGTKLLLWYMIEDGRKPYADKFTLGEDSYYPTIIGESDGMGRLVLRLSDDAVLEKLLNYYRYMIDVEGVDWIRVDNWSRELSAWRANDKSESTELFGSSNLRGGITENKYICNFYKLWDTLYEEYPEFSLDNCCSGGRRIDIEMTMRGIPLWRTDYNSNDREVQQYETQILSRWIPFSTVGCVANDKYHLRSNYGGSVNFAAAGAYSGRIFGTVDNYKEACYVRKYWYGTYHQILEATADKTSWQAYELFREDLKSGILVVIRRPNSDVSRMTIKLKQLDKNGYYIVHDITHGDNAGYDSIYTGSQLMNTGIEIPLLTSSQSVVLEITSMY